MALNKNNWPNLWRWFTALCRLEVPFGLLDLPEDELDVLLK